ncbi:hypothetical protein JTB14_015472 [Gonioctena quinquepunctata]|nr:hypothetical protein JTB14_015472 [Gonioctena quinquepunctata]
MFIFLSRNFKMFPRAMPFRNHVLSKNSSFLSSRFFQHSIRTRNFSTRQQNITDVTDWKGILYRFIPVGICLIGVMQWRAFRKRQGDMVASQWEINCYCMLPLRSLSRCWGYLADINLPEFLRPPVYKVYSNTFGVNISEAENEDLKSYPSLADFFARSLKDGVRKVDMESCLVSPCDGTVLHFGTVDTEQVEQVKGVTYSLKDFLGEQSLKGNNNNGNFRTSLLHPPGDYHRFHSPTEWKPTHRRHFAGQLLSVNPSIARWLPGLFTLNERAVYLGQWKYGFFSYTAVGATNVGTVKVYFDRTLQTNQQSVSKTCKDQCLGSAIDLQRGDLIGEFRMGSTIVLIFEAPNSFKFSISPGDRLKMGQQLGCVGQQKFVDRILNDRIGFKGVS